MRPTLHPACGRPRAPLSPDARSQRLVRMMGLSGILLLILLFFVNVKRVPLRYRRVYAIAGFLLLAGLVAGLAVGCGGGYGGGGGGTHYDTITAAYSGDSTYAGSTSAGITITVQ